MHLPVSIISDVVTVIYSGESRSENPKLEIKINPVPKPLNESMPCVYWTQCRTTGNKISLKIKLLIIFYHFEFS